MLEKKRSLSFVALLIITLIACQKKNPSNPPVEASGIFNWEAMVIHQGPAWFSDIDFTDDAHGWVVGRSTADTQGGLVYRTIDNGVNWNRMRRDSLYNYVGCHFFGADTGFVVGWEVMGPGLIWMTTDGGATLTQVYNESSNNFRRIYFINRSIGWALGEGSIVKTVDGGTTWNPIPNHPDASRLRSMFLVSEIELYAVGDGWNGLGFAAQTANGGNTWNKLDIGPDTCSIYEIAFTDDSTAWVVASTTGQGVIFKSLDGGSTWRDLSNETIEAFGANTICFLNSSIGWLGGPALFETVNGGDTWLREMPDPIVPFYIQDFEKMSPNLVWACGGVLEGVILKGTRSN